MVEVENGMNVQVYTCGKMRRLRIVTGDRMKLNLSPCDLPKGRINIRYKD